MRLRKNKQKNSEKEGTRIRVSDLGLRLGKDGKLRLSMDKRAYKGPRLGDFIADVFKTHSHKDLIKLESKTVPPCTRVEPSLNSEGNAWKHDNNLNRRTKHADEQKCERKSGNEGTYETEKKDKMKEKSLSRMLAPFIGLQKDSPKDSEPSRTKPSKDDSAKSRNLLNRNLSSKGRHEDGQLREQKDVKNMLRKLCHVRRPHRSLVVRRITRVTKQERSRVLEMCLEHHELQHVKQSQSCPSLRRRLHEQDGVTPVSSLVTGRRKELHARLKSSLATSSSVAHSKQKQLPREKGTARTPLLNTCG
eukprot:CAMPEP_0184494190 /NCGR_PEP_ID=MMETSP0113_2-20130426/28077_1 /TAXON_ID=91329 /ORGANISM="Norrisiella sphaerica, Strain BC52" /LENGTH=304 /DNA_ID=CAMNT_0026879835 /DNA_START=46 /DNA_END=960 /DNA_ORIENTATION=+